MSAGHPPDTTWDRLLAGSLAPSEIAAAERHLTSCEPCARRFAKQKVVIEAIAAPLESIEPEANVATVMRRIGARPKPVPLRERLWQSLRPRWVVAPAFAAVAVLTVAVAVVPRLRRSGFVARGGDTPKTLAQQVGVHFAALEPEAVQLSPGMAVSRKSGLLVSYRNLETQRSVYLLAFALDAAGNVHWLYPAYQTVGTNPESVRLEARASETVMAQAVLLESPALGPLRLVSVVSPNPLHVLDVEALSAGERTRRALQARWPDAAVNETPVVLTP